MTRLAGLAFGLTLLAAGAPGSAAQNGQGGGQDQMSLNLLTAPSAPAFVLLGLEPTSIERPGSLTDFALSLRNATDDFSVLPESYAITVAPYWLSSAANDLTYEQFESGRGALLRSTTISLATTTTTDETTGVQTTSLGLGLSLSLVQGPIDQSNGYKEQVDTLRQRMNALASELSDFQAARLLDDPDPLLERLELRQEDAIDRGDTEAATEAARLVQERTDELAQEAEEEFFRTQLDEIDELRERASSLPLRRTGFNLDLAVGSVIDFVARDFDQEEFRTAGAWLTGSLEQPWGAALGVGRAIHDWTDDVTSFDVGGRLIIDDMKGLTASVESLARLSPNEDTRDTEWRVAFSADYSVGANRVVSFTFGRDFEGRETSDLILAVNFAMGFGSLRPGF